MASPSVAESATRLPLIDQVRAFDVEIEAIIHELEDAIKHANETVRLAESLHESHPSLIQRAHGATIANEPPGIHHQHWQNRSFVRGQGHEDKLASERFFDLYCEVMSKSLKTRGQVGPQTDESTIQEMTATEDKIERMRVDLERLKTIVGSREHEVGDGDGE